MTQHICHVYCQDYFGIIKYYAYTQFLNLLFLFLKPSVRELLSNYIICILSCFDHYLSISLLGFYIFISFCVYIFMFIIWVVIILICSSCCCCCFCCWSFCQCIMVTICFCSPDIGLWLMTRSR